MSRAFAITVYVEAADAVAAIDAAGDLWLDTGVIHRMAGLGEGVDVRPAEELKQALAAIDGGDIEMVSPEPETIDLMDALKASLAKKAPRQ